MEQRTGALEGEDMRITEEVIDIDYKETKRFFERRADKFSDDNPYSVTMYQDRHTELVRERNRKETEKLMPMLNLNADSRVLDVACGIGRWADAMPDCIKEYCGLDFSRELVEIARKRNKKDNFSFWEEAANEVEQIVQKTGGGVYDRILMVGILMYLNDRDLADTLEQIEKISQEHTVICIREPIGILKRLTLKDFFSEELEDNYNAIYRTRQELRQFISNAFLQKGFAVSREGFLFDEDALNNRKETAQYFYILER